MASQATGERRHKAKAGGTGKKTKTFSESLGLSHLLSIASSAGSKEEVRNRERAEKNRSTDKWRKAKKNSSRSKDDEQSKQASSHSDHLARTKSVIKADLKARRRAKAKMRKDRRKFASQTAAEMSESEDEQAITPSSTEFQPKRAASASSKGSLKKRSSMSGKDPQHGVSPTAPTAATKKKRVSFAAS
ncbi:unnamed protein product [Jaminaea pallidilutea]